MPQLSSKSVPILEGTALLVRRSNTPRWQVKYKVGGKWMRTSTKKTDIDDAKKVAVEVVLDAKHKQKFGLPIVTRSFRAVAQLAIRRMESELNGGHGKVVFNDYINALENYFIPFFGAKHISTIDFKALREFDDWRAAKLGRLPKASTVNTHTSALNRVFDEAVNENYITRSRIPAIKFKKVDGERRPDFTLREYIRLYRYMRSWVKQPMHRAKSTHMRLLLRDVVLLLANTGIRYGTELYNLKWKHIELRDEYLVINVDGKTKRRELIARRNAKRYLRRIASRNYSDLPFEEVLCLDEFVIQLPDGSKTRSLHQTFRKLLEDAKLKVDPRTDQARTLYSLRHFYITQRLINLTMDTHTIAKQCGTSIAMLEKHYSHLEVWDKREALAK